MHKFIFRDDVVETVRTVYAHIRRPPPPDTLKAKNLGRRARNAVNGLLRTPPPANPPPLRSPELLTVALALAADTTPAARTERDDAELAVAMYLAYELVKEIREDQRIVRPRPDTVGRG